MIYKPFYREVDIKGYQPRYTQKYEEPEEIIFSIPEEEFKGETFSKEDKVENDEGDKSDFQRGPRGVIKDRKKFKDHMIQAYEKELLRKGLNPMFAKSLAAQDILESGWGQHLAGDYNYGGIKGKGSNRQTKEYIDGRYIDMVDSFRNFKSEDDYIKYKVNLLNNSRYNAFGGDIEGFADRVAMGGYATAPNYAQALRDVIHSMKSGGVIKYETGGSAAAKNWANYWYSHRTKKIEDNVRRNMLFPAPVNGGSIYDYMRDRMDTIETSVNPDKLPSHVDGRYNHFSREVNLRNDDRGIALHEITHGIVPNEFKKAVEKIKKGLDYNIYSSDGTPNSYRDQNKEILANLNKWRMKYNINPDKDLTLEDIFELRKKEAKAIRLQQLVEDKDGNRKIKITIFDKDNNIISSEPLEEEERVINSEVRVDMNDDADEMWNYNDQLLMQLNNNIASNKKERSTIYAKLGMKIPKFQNSGTIAPYKDFYWDSEEKYDYAHGVYDKESEHWSSRDPKSGLELKHPSHPTHMLGQYYDKKAGYKRFQDQFTGRYYTFSPEESITKSIMPWLKEVEYENIPVNVFDSKVLEKYGHGHSAVDIYERYLPYADIISKASKRYNIPEDFLKYLIFAESRYNKDAKNKSTKATGLMQIMPMHTKGVKDPNDPEFNINKGCEIMRYFKDRGRSWEQVLEDYNGFVRSGKEPDQINKMLNNDYYRLLKLIAKKLDENNIK